MMISLCLLLCMSLLSEISFSLQNIFDAILGPLIDGMFALAARGGKVRETLLEGKTEYQDIYIV